ncbi:hypothetical protein Cs7R123_52360 [Catellatospora sp. TT07R-123]|uniref:hypothetical protein n=1 Tax=Catellatospora sp. TT07R-123 TaxID=2733863 RepID=UPI001B041334|nr:hypothetical protein [Catellatospora sp. TT07R-123]GHJ47894.1 hypothetical protein Cs7R123_52360 [Catellatospora sp. TT07R-123]
MELGERLRRRLGQDWGFSPLLPGEPAPGNHAADPGPTPGPDEVADTLLDLPRTGQPRDAALADLDTWTAASWVRLDEALRRATYASRRFGVGQRLRQVLLDGTADEIDLIVGACHSDGRLREAATILLAGHRRPATAAVLALRTCDWAHQVRTAARRSFADVLADSRDDGSVLVTATDHAIALRDRQHGGWLWQHVTALLPQLFDTEPGLAPLLAARLDRVRRLAYETAIAHDRLDLRWLLAAAQRDPDTVVRRICAQAVLAQAATNLPILRALRDSRSALVRAEAVRLLARAGEFDADTALADRFPLVREVAQAAVRRRGGDPAEHYRRLAAAQPLSLPVLAGLGETGTAADAALLVPGLRHPAVKGRLTALRALRRLGAVPVEPLLPLLDDPSVAVLRLTARTLAEQPAADLGPLRDLTGSGHPAQRRVIAFRLLDGHDQWWDLTTALAWLDDPDQEIRELARQKVQQWPHYGRLRQPTETALGAIAEAIDRAEPMIGVPRADMLRFIARTGPHTRR